MATFYNVNKTFQGVNGYGTQFSNETYSCTLAANTNTTLTVPTDLAMGMAPATTKGTFIAVFHYAYGSNVYVANNVAAAAPAGGSFAVTGSVLNPTAKTVKVGDVLNFLCVAGAVVVVEFFSTQEN